MSSMSFKDAIKVIRRQQRQKDLRRMRENTGALIVGSIVLYAIAFKLRKK